MICTNADGVCTMSATQSAPAMTQNRYLCHRPLSTDLGCDRHNRSPGVWLLASNGQAHR